jgi:xanthine/uracil permease
MNRGIFAEGLGACLGAVFGGLPCTSYTQNIGIIATTRVASRFVVQIAAGILILYGLSPKFGGLLVAMPRSVLGGVFVLITGMIVVSGARLLQRSLQSNADAIVVGLTLIVSLALPIYAQNGLPADWLEARPMALRLLMTNSVVLAVATAVGLNVLLQDRSSEPTGLEP